MSILECISFLGSILAPPLYGLYELGGTGANKALVKYGYVPIDPKLSLSDARPDQQKLVQVVRDLLAEAKVTVKTLLSAAQPCI